ncbi:phosphotransferase [Streptomyces sp. ISL-12]|uniref:phosphotransferase n=1 Tax=Streptomyces sp. ISL-12 TaxID=2819177 RepID=UPI001BE96490|nr:phosphotransferase [Streptomyces sp. ISL-12]MBT2411733.1 phosphotransferase [Streptomyces sp. ISL-12]
MTLERHIPSTTGYVHQTRVGDRILYAKTSILGVSLVSLLRGACGPWPAVRRAQRAYAMQLDGLMTREAAQLQVLAEMDRPQVCTVAGVREGVIFTEPVTGPSLGEVLLTRPADTCALLVRTFDELRPLHRPGAAHRLALGGAIGERSIAGTFLRKFNGLSGETYLDRLGAERCEPGARAEVIELARRSVVRLRKLRVALPGSVGTSLAYGDLKPEHVLFTHGPDERPVLLDPGMFRASPMVDIAKMISRTVLLLAARRPDLETARQVVEGIGAFTEQQAGRQAGRERSAWERGLLTLWMMDTVNILATYLSAPAVLPLPGVALALVDRAVPVCRLVDEVSADLAERPAGRGPWERALVRAWAVAS